MHFCRKRLNVVTQRTVNGCATETFCRYRENADDHAHTPTFITSNQTLPSQFSLITSLALRQPHDTSYPHISLQIHRGWYRKACSLKDTIPLSFGSQTMPFAVFFSRIKRASARLRASTSVRMGGGRPIAECRCVPAPFVAGQPDTLMQGFVTKQTKNRNWRQRYAILTPRLLFFPHSPHRTFIARRKP